MTSSPRYPQSNGESERAVQTMKALLNKCDDEYLALLNYRNTPLQNGYSPAQLSMNRRLKTRVPCLKEELMPKVPDLILLRKREKEYREKMAKNYNHRHRVVEGDVLSPGDRVWVPDLKTEGTVVKHHDSPRSVVIQTPQSVVRRNRCMTRRLDAPVSPFSGIPTAGGNVPAEMPMVTEQPLVAEQPEFADLATATQPAPVVEPDPPPEPQLRRSGRVKRPIKRYDDEF